AVEGAVDRNHRRAARTGHAAEDRIVLLVVRPRVRVLWVVRSLPAWREVDGYGVRRATRYCVCEDRIAGAGGYKHAVAAREGYEVPRAVRGAAYPVVRGADQHAGLTDCRKLFADLVVF